MNIGKEDLQEIMKAAISSLKTQEQLEQEREAALRRQNKAAAAQMLREAHATDPDGARKRNCTHSRWPMTMGRMGGHPAPRGQGEWRTGVQIHGDGTATTICLLCQATWHFSPTAEELSYVIDGGGVSMAPPDIHWPGTSPRLIFEPEPAPKEKPLAVKTEMR